MAERPRPASATRTADNPFAFLDGLRGLAAAYVVCGHARWLLWEGHAGFLRHPGEYGPLERALVYASSALRFGHEAVLLFFVISGFVIHLRYARRFAAGRGAEPFGLADYARRRARRIYPPLLVAMAVTAALDLSGRALGLPILAGPTAYPAINTITSDLGVVAALGNLAFLMTVAVPVFGSNGPLWSLMYEGWFYAFYPLVWRARARSIALATAGLVAAAAAARALDVPLLGIVLPLMVVWWLGALLAEAALQHRRGALRVAAVLSALVPALPFLRPPGLAHDLLWGLAFFGLIAALLLRPTSGPGVRALASLGWLGDFSYTLYLVHFPALVFLSGWLMARGGGELPRHQGWIPVGVALALVLARALFVVAERPFLGARRSPGEGAPGGREAAA